MVERSATRRRSPPCSVCTLTRQRLPSKSTFWNPSARVSIRGKGTSCSRLASRVAFVPVDHPSHTSYVANRAVPDLLANGMDQVFDGVAVDLLVPAVDPVLQLAP